MLTLARFRREFQVYEHDVFGTENLISGPIRICPRSSARLRLLSPLGLHLVYYLTPPQCTSTMTLQLCANRFPLDILIHIMDYLALEDLVSCEKVRSFPVINIRLDLLIDE